MKWMAVFLVMIVLNEYVHVGSWAHGLITFFLVGSGGTLAVENYRWRKMKGEED